MLSARNVNSLPSASADGTAVRVRSSLTIDWLPGMAHRTASFPMSRGIKR